MFDQDEQEISQIIENGLEAILTGRATLESVVAQHPEQAETLRPELEGALWLVSRRQEVEARPGFVTASRKRVVERIKAEARSQGARHSLFGFAWPKQHTFQWVMVVVVLMVLMTGAGSLLTVSQSALPGDGLYMVKRISESVSFSVALNEVQRVELSAQFAERRLHEASTLIGRGEYYTAEASLQDYEQGIAQTLVLLEEVETKETEPVAVEHLAVTVKEGLVTNTERLAEIAEQVPPGENGRVTVRVQKALSVSRNGVLTANRVYEKIQEKKAAPTAIPAAPTQTKPAIQPTAVPKTPTKAPTEAPRPTDTSVPNTPVPTSPPSVRDTAVPKPTATPSSVPTATEVPLPTSTPTDAPTQTAVPIPTETPAPTQTDVPTDIPTDIPTEVPTDVPTVAPEPTGAPLDVESVPDIPAETSTEIPTVGAVFQPTEIETTSPSATPIPEATEAVTPEVTPDATPDGAVPGV